LRGRDSRKDRVFPLPLVRRRFVGYGDPRLGEDVQERPGAAAFRGRQRLIRTMKLVEKIGCLCVDIPALCQNTRASFLCIQGARAKALDPSIDLR
jgi:hypothetical protein